MLRKSAYILGFLTLFLFSCDKGPGPMLEPPSPQIVSHFYAEFDASVVEWTVYNDGPASYELDYIHTTLINPLPTFSEIIYGSRISSTSTSEQVLIQMGTIFWAASDPEDNRPPPSDFSAFFQTNLTPIYTDGAQNGFQFSYTDDSGRLWQSSENSTMPMNVEFTGVVQDITNDDVFSNYICEFDCWIYSLNPDSLALTPSVNHMDSIHVENARMESRFQR